ncbi:MAG: copper homeostasis protein CutC [Chitinophagaceae bacterium]
MTQPSKIILEVCAGSVHSALAAQEGGADRVELCDNLLEGGTTPSYATIALTKKLLKIPIYPIIRPRGGDFLYDDLELEIMKNDIQVCKHLGCEGVVIGLLTSEGRVDKINSKLLIDLAWPMEVTFHRAFDMTPNPFEALEDIISLGCERILTSGQKSTAADGAELLAELVKRAANEILIMPGAGIRENNIQFLVQKTQAIEYHTSAKVIRESKMKYKNLEATHEGRGHELDISMTDPAIVRKIRLLAESA